MAKLLTVIFCILLISPFVVSEDKTTDNGTQTEPEVVTIAKWPHCEKSLEPDDIGIFDVDIWYKVGDRLEYSRSEGDERLPYTLQLGKKNMLPAVEKAIVGMCIGEHRKVTVPPHLAFGNKTIIFPDGRELPGGATVINEFKLIQILRNTDEERKKQFQIIDIDGNDKIDEDEIIAIGEVYSTLLDKKDDEEAKKTITDLFKSVDEDKDGSITMEELYSGQATSDIATEASIKVMNNILKKFVRNTPKPKPAPNPSCPTCPAAKKKPCPQPPPCDRPKCGRFPSKSSTAKTKSTGCSEEKSNEKKVMDELENKNQETSNEREALHKKEKERKKKDRMKENYNKKDEL